MLATVALVVSLAVADSINPLTIAIAIYLASTPNPRRRLLGYASGVFCSYFAGGLVLVIAPGELLRGAAASSHTRVFHLTSVIVGSVVIALAVVLWIRRRRLTQLRVPAWALRTRSSFVLGAAVTAIDLLTAFPYFAAIAAIVSADVALPGQVLLLVIFNALYVLPLVAVLVAHELFGARMEPALARARTVVERLSAVVLALLTLGAGIFLLVRGVIGLTG